MTRVLLRLATLSLVAAAFVALTIIYGHSVQISTPGPGWQAERLHHPPVPAIVYFLEFVGAGLEVLLFAVIGRMFLRLRLSAASRNDGQLVSLALRRTARPDGAAISGED